MGHLEVGGGGSMCVVFSKKEKNNEKKTEIEIQIFLMAPIFFWVGGF